MPEDISFIKEHIRRCLVSRNENLNKFVISVNLLEALLKDEVPENYWEKNDEIL